MPKIVISDTSILIIFQKIAKLELLKKVYTELTTTIEIAEEYGEKLPPWIKVIEVKDKKYQKLLETQLDKGESSAIALAQESENSLLLLDDLKARKLADKLNLKVTGTLGIIHKAKQKGCIKSVRPILELLKNTNFRISEKIIEELLRLNSE